MSLEKQGPFKPFSLPPTTFVSSTTSPLHVSLSEAVGGVSNFVIEHNWLTGGNYTLYGITDNQGVFVRNNIFGRDNGGLLGGKEDRRIRTGDCEEWSGNTWENTGGPI